MNPLDLSQLNEPQLKATKHIEGPILILAGAGSGKTRVLTYRIAHLIEHSIAPNQILAVTFTNKAAKEMEERVGKILAENPSQNGGKPTLGTFHSLCVRILRQDIEKLEVGLTRHFVIFDSADTLSLVKAIMKERNITDKEFKPKAILSHISSAKNLLTTTQKHFDKIYDNENNFTRVVNEIFPIYKRKLIEHNALDFDDLLQKTVELFEQVPNTLKKYQDRWQYILVDEYQDTNFAQYRLIRLLTEQRQNLCVVGDDHQSIYSFRGADFRNILDFEKDFPEARVVKLEQNYRSSGNILKNANNLIGHNKTGRAKNLWTEQSAGEKIQIHQIYDEKDEGTFIASKVKKLVDEGQSLKDMAILYRMNAQSRAIEEALLRNQIQYQIVGGVRFFDRKEIKDIVAYLRLIFNPRDDLAFLRIINVPARKIGTATIEVVRAYAQNYGISLYDVLEGIHEVPELNDGKKKALYDFYQIIESLKNIHETKTLILLLDSIVEKTGFMKFLNDGTAEGESRMQNVKELFSVASRYDAAEDPVAAFLEGIALISDLDNMNQNQDSITLMTVHASKGLEFPTVFLPGWEENMFPSSSSQFDPNQLEEERRLGYVAITRAEKLCHISYTQQRMLFGQTNYSAPSSFISELDENCVELHAMSGRPKNNRSQFNKYSSYNTANSESSIKNRIPDSKAKKTEHTLLQKQPSTRTEALFGRVENETSYKIGERIRHKDWGDGTILQVAGDVIAATFKGMGMKKIVASVAPIEKIEKED